MKKLLLKTWLMLVCLLAGVGTSWAETMSVDFEATDLATYSAWTFNNFTTHQTNSNVSAHGGSYFGSCAATSAYAATAEKISSPTSIVCYYNKLTTNTNNSSLFKIQVSTNGTDWTDVASGKTMNNVTRGTWEELSADLSSYSNVYVRVFYTGTNAGRTIDDITLTYTTSGGGGSTPTALSVPTNLASSNVTTTGATLSWNAVSNASSYTVKIGETEYTGVNTNSYSATGLTAGTQYTWTVKAVGDGVNYSTSAYAANANFTTEAEQGGGEEPSGDVLSIDFESEASAYSDWTLTNINTKQTNSNVPAHGGDYFGNTAGTQTASIVTKNKVNPGTISFYVSKQTTNTTSSNWKIQVSNNGTSWTDVKTQSATSMDRGSWVEVTQDLSEYSDVYVRVYYTGSTAARCIDDLTLTLAEDPEVDPEKTVTKITVTGTPATFWKGDTFNHNGMTVTATYDDDSNADVTSLAEFSAPDMSTSGNKTVTVTYQGKTDTYNITVQTIANTQATAYTVAQAKSIIDAGKDLTTEVYVSGKISQIDSYNSTYKSITYWISEDGTTTNQFEVYGGLNLNNTGFDAQSDIVLGADVVIYGVIKKYSGTYEFDKNNYLVSYTAPVVKTKPELSFAKPSVTAYLDALGEFESLTVITNPVGLAGVQYSSSDNEKATVDANTGVVTINNEATPGSVTITASYAETEDYAAAEDASYTINIVANKPVAVKRAVVAQVGETYYAMTTTDASNTKMIAVEVSVVDNKVVYNGSEDIVWDWFEFEANTGYLSTNDTKLAARASDKTDIRLGTDYTNYDWTVDATNGLVNAVSTGRALLVTKSGDNYVFGNYATSNIGNKSYSSKASLMEITPSATITLNSACTDGEYVYGTYSNTSAWVVPDNLIVSEVGIVDGALYVESYKTSDVVPANTGVMVSASAGGDYTVEIETDAELIEAAESVLGNNNCLHPSSETMTGNNLFYRLTMHNGNQIGFWWGAEDGAAFSLAANKAYLAVPRSEGEAAVRGFAFNGGEATAIKSVNASTHNAVYYNLNGQRVNTNAKGIIVTNGKKHLVK